MMFKILIRFMATLRSCEDPSRVDIDKYTTYAKDLTSFAVHFQPQNSQCVCMTCNSCARYPNRVFVDYTNNYSTASLHM